MVYPLLCNVANLVLLFPSHRIRKKKEHWLFLWVDSGLKEHGYFHFSTVISPDSLSLALRSAVIYTFTEGQQIRRGGKLGDAAKGRQGESLCSLGCLSLKTTPAPHLFHLWRKRENLRTQPPMLHVYPVEVLSTLPLLPYPLLSPRRRESTSFPYVKIPTSEDLLKLSTFKAEYISIPWHRYMSTFVYHMTKIRISQWFYSYELKTRTQMSIYSRMDKPIAKYSPSGIPYNS